MEKKKFEIEEEGNVGHSVGRDNSKTWEIEIFEENMRRDHEEPCPKKLKDKLSYNEQGN